VIVDVADVFSRKLELCKHYASQTTLRDYAAELEVLARFQASYSTRGAALCEVFFAQPRKEFVADVLSRELDQPETLKAGNQPVRE
jgi:hypothetical protein